jgi:hypothetical protein
LGGREDYKFEASLSYIDTVSKNNNKKGKNKTKTRTVENICLLCRFSAILMRSIGFQLYFMRSPNAPPFYFLNGSPGDLGLSWRDWGELR